MPSVDAVQPVLLCLGHELDEEHHFHWIVPEWDIYDRMRFTIADDAIDFIQGPCRANLRLQTFLHVHHVSGTEMIYHISAMHERLQEAELQMQRQQQQLRVVVEYEPALARTLCLTMTAEDLA